VQGAVPLPSYVRLQFPGQFFEECLESILHGVSVQHYTPTVQEFVLAVWHREQNITCT
jgi:hypothetical protein